MTLRRPKLLLLTALLLSVGSGVFAADPAPPARLPETVSRIERETGARVLSAQRSQREGREMNRIKLLTPEGRVRVVWDDPQQGRAPNLAPRPGERSRLPAADAVRRAEARQPEPRDDG